MNNSSTQHETLRRLTLSAMLIAVTVVISRLFIIPVPMTHGNINLCDAGVLIAAMLLGSRDGASVGAISGFLLDLLSGYGQYMFFSFIVHGLEGLVAGLMLSKVSKNASKIISLVLAVIIMTIGYFLADSLLYSVSIGLIGVATNLIQGLVGVVIAYVVGPKIIQLIKK
ncbi:MAG: ECF transporter S component [Furfurilactobacillus sp.]|jgi:ECF transporter S component (folate family)|uniref:ECF transporter S component n=1 Tax=Furfurilactobacillus sp. TaxID=2767911 RepID=UPI00258EE6AE|nr:ECF transporter S component [Furfurilactobacillus sp.]MCH4010925.1 ECF transporter S component [Furfurilactobacillus sp.]MCH4036817.1 ECF transporter S component [Furfurilactobacillus sp.]MCH4114237.1 ECF transporter S component [Furfurilactobacillus sp.]MCH4132940.1 ECF transporter S component [Furfurilactobacillus sp.]MCI1339372.1 ECF transporter S component [Furfurilactobacillus sp.]